MRIRYFAMLLLAGMVQMASGQVILSPQKEVTQDRYKRPLTEKPEGTKETPPDPERRGPTNKPVSIFEQISSDYEFGNDFFDVLNVDGQLYEDDNPQSGYYYYFPKEYQLSWEPGINDHYGFQLEVNYLSTGVEGGKQLVTIKLQPNITKSDLDLARILLQNTLKNKVNRPFKELQSVPLAEASKISFKKLEGIIAANDVELSVPSNFLDPIVVFLKTDRVDDLLAILFSDVGLRGDLLIKPAGDLPEQVIPVTIKPDYRKTFGTIELNPNAWRGKEWQNPAPYPVMLKNLHILRIETKNGTETPVIYTWQMGDKEVPESGKARFDASLLPNWLDTDPKVKKMWIEYAVKPCYDCNALVKSSLLNATEGSEIKEVLFDLLDPIEYSGAAKLRIKIRSTQLTQGNKTKTEISLDPVTSDGATQSFKLFVPVGQKPQFEYSVSLIMKDGNIVKSDWVSNNKADEIGIGRAFIKANFPEVKK